MEFREHIAVRGVVPHMPSHGHNFPPTCCFRKAALILTIVVAALCAWSCGAATFSTTPIADAFVTPGANGSLSSSNFGAAGALAIAAGGLPQGAFQSVIKFDLSSMRSSLDAQYGQDAWTVQSITLQLTATPHGNAIFNPVAAGQFSVSLMQDNSWVEGTGSGGIPTSDGISYNSLLNNNINKATDQGLGTFSFGGGTSGTSTYSLNLSSSLISDLVAGDDLSLRLFAADDQVSYLFSARSSAGIGSPTLTIVATPEPGGLSLMLCGTGLAALARWQFAKSKKLGTFFSLARRIINEN